MFSIFHRNQTKMIEKSKENWKIFAFLSLDSIVDDDDDDCVHFVLKTNKIFSRLVYLFPIEMQPRVYFCKDVDFLLVFFFFVFNCKLYEVFARDSLALSVVSSTNKQLSQAIFIYFHIFFATSLDYSVALLTLSSKHFSSKKIWERKRVSF